MSESGLETLRLKLSSFARADVQVPAKSGRELGYQTESALGGWGGHDWRFRTLALPSPAESQVPPHCGLGVVVPLVFAPASI